MSVLQNLFGASQGQLSDRLRVRDLDEYEPGNTIPPVHRSKSNVSHLKTFEMYADDIVENRNKLAQNRSDMIELDRLANEERRRLDEVRSELELEQNTLHDQLNQHVEIVYPHAKLVHTSPPPPDPSELDVQVWPPVIPPQENE